MSTCSYRPDRRGGVRTSAMRLPEDLLELVQRSQRNYKPSALVGLANAFLDLRNDILLFERGTDYRWKEFARTKLSPFEWPVVVSLVAEEGYQPFIETMPVPPEVSASARAAALEVLKTLRANLDWEPAYQELASRAVVAGAADEIAAAAFRIDDLKDREEQHRELADLFPFICSVWILGREARKGAVRWRPIVFQGMEVA